MTDIDARFNSIWTFMDNLNEKINRIHDRVVLIERALGAMSKVMEDGDE